MNSKINYSELKKFLPYNYACKIASKYPYSKSTIHKVANGLRNNDEILQELITMAKASKIKSDVMEFGTVSHKSAHLISYTLVFDGTEQPHSLTLKSEDVASTIELLKSMVRDDAKLIVHSCTKK